MSYVELIISASVITGNDYHRYHCDRYFYYSYLSSVCMILLRNYIKNTCLMIGKIDGSTKEDTTSSHTSVSDFEKYEVLFTSSLIFSCGSKLKILLRATNSWRHYFKIGFLLVLHKRIRSFCSLTMSNSNSSFTVHRFFSSLVS